MAVGYPPDFAREIRAFFSLFAAGFGRCDVEGAPPATFKNKAVRRQKGNHRISCEGREGWRPCRPGLAVRKDVVPPLCRRERKHGMTSPAAERRSYSAIRSIGRNFGLLGNGPRGRGPSLRAQAKPCLGAMARLFLSVVTERRRYWCLQMQNAGLRAVPKTQPILGQDLKISRSAPVQNIG